MWLLSELAMCASSKLRSDIWDHVESYAIHMFFARRLKITFTSNLKLTKSFLVLLILVLLFNSSYHLLPQLGTLHLTLHVYLRLANRPSARTKERVMRFCLHLNIELL